MFFYTSLFVASLIVALILVWLYRAILGAGKAVYRAILPSSKSNPTDHRKRQAVRTTVNDAVTPWGWGEHVKLSQAARTAAIAPSNAIPWGWRGSKRKISERAQRYDLSASAAFAKPVSDQAYISNPESDTQKDQSEHHR